MSCPVYQVWFDMAPGSFLESKTLLILAPDGTDITQDFAVREIAVRVKDRHFLECEVYMHHLGWTVECPDNMVNSTTIISASGHRLEANTMQIDYPIDGYRMIRVTFDCTFGRNDVWLP
jgi:hypothetical protein